MILALTLPVCLFITLHLKWKMLKHFSHSTDTLKFTAKNKLWKGCQEQMTF